MGLLRIDPSLGLSNDNSVLSTLAVVIKVLMITFATEMLSCARCYIPFTDRDIKEIF